MTDASRSVTGPEWQQRIWEPALGARIAHEIQNTDALVASADHMEVAR